MLICIIVFNLSRLKSQKVKFNNGLVILVFSKKRWDSFSPADQEIIRQAAHESTLYSREICKSLEEESLAAVRDGGSTIVTDVNKASFQNAMNPVYSRFVTSEQQRNLLRIIQNL